MDGIDRVSWKFVFPVLGILLSLLLIFESIMRKYLKIEKRKSFSYNHVNEKHKKIDAIIRIGVIIIILITVFYLIVTSSEPVWCFEPLFLILLFLVVSETTRAFMEWKYAENPKAYILTISQLIFTLILLGIISFLNYLSWF